MERVLIDQKHVAMGSSFDSVARQVRRRVRASFNADPAEQHGIGKLKSTVLDAFNKKCHHTPSTLLRWPAYSLVYS